MKVEVDFKQPSKPFIQRSPQFIHSFLLDKCFILVNVMVDPKPVPGTLGRRVEHNLKGTQVITQINMFKMA